MKMVADDNGMVDLQLGASGLVAEDTLESAVIVSLLTDRRAGLDDELPDGSESSGVIPPDRRGWAGDALAEADGDRIGSRLWLLNREKQTEETRRRAIEYAREALQWMIDDGHATAVEIDAEWAGHGRLNISVEILLPRGGRFSSVIPYASGGSHAI